MSDHWTASGGMAAVLNQRGANLDDRDACRMVLIADHEPDAVEHHLDEAIEKARRWRAIEPPDTGNLASNLLLILSIVMVACACITAPAWASDGTSGPSTWAFAGLALIGIIALSALALSWIDPLDREDPSDKSNPPT